MYSSKLGQMCMSASPEPRRERQRISSSAALAYDVKERVKVQFTDGAQPAISLRHLLSRAPVLLQTPEFTRV